MWTGAMIAKSSTNPAMRAAARTFTRAFAGLAVAIEPDAVELHPMVDEAETELLGDPLL